MNNDVVSIVIINHLTNNSSCALMDLKEAVIATAVIDSFMSVIVTK